MEKAAKIKVTLTTGFDVLVGVTDMGLVDKLDGFIGFWKDSELPSVIYRIDTVIKLEVDSGC